MKKIAFLAVLVVSLIFINLLMAEENLKQATGEEIKNNLRHLKEVLSGPDTASSQFFTLSAINGLAKERDSAIPYAMDFFKSANMYERRFAVDLYIKIGSDKSLKLILDRFCELYDKKNNLDTIDTASVYLGNFSFIYDFDSNTSAGRNEYWEARYIFKKLLKENSKILSDLCPKLINDNNGIAVMATKYMWKKYDEKYKNRFCEFANLDKNKEVFFTFIDELGNIVEKENEKDYQGLEWVKKKFMPKAILIANDTDVDEYIFEKVINYLSLAEPKWFAENWIELYRTQWNDDLGENRDVAFNIALAKNKIAKDRIGELEKFISPNKYENFRVLVEDLVVIPEKMEPKK